MNKLNKKEVQQKVDEFFKRDKLDSASVKKIKTLAMAYRIRLGEYRKRFCKNCYSDLKHGAVRIKNGKKQDLCNACNYVNRWNIKKN